MMKNKRADLEQQKTSSNTNQINQAVEKAKKPKNLNGNQEKNDDPLYNKKQITHHLSESKITQSPNSSKTVKRHNSEINKQDLSFNLPKKNDLSFENHLPKTQSESSFLNDENENMQIKSDEKQTIDNNQSQNQQPKPKNQFRTIQLQKMHNRNLQKEQANKNLQNKKQIVSQQQKQLKQCNDPSYSQNQNNHNQISSIGNDHQSQQPKLSLHQDQQEKDKLKIQSTLPNQQLTPDSKATHHPYPECRKSSSLVSKERPSLLINKSQNIPSKDNSIKNQRINEKDINETRRKKKEENSSSNLSSNNVSFSKPIKLEFSKSTSIIYYVDNPQPPKIIGNIISLLDGQPRLFFKKNVFKRKLKGKIDDSNNIEKNEEFKKELIGRPPIPQFLGTSVISEEEEEEDNDDDFIDQVSPNDIMNKYWPKKCESQRTFEEEFNFNDSMRVSSIRNFDEVIPKSPTKEEMPPPVPQQITDMEKKYMVAPPSPLSPFHVFNPRKMRRLLLNKVINHIETPSKSDEKLQNKRSEKPKRESLSDDENMQPEIEDFAFEYDDYTKDIDIEKIIKIENDYEYEYDYQYESENESESESESESEKEVETKNEAGNKSKTDIDNQDNDQNKTENKNEIIDKNKDNDENKIKIQNENENKEENDEDKTKSENETDESEKETEKQDEKTENVFMNTNKNLLPELRNYEKLISKMDNEDIFDMVTFIENELKGFNNMTSIKGPLYEEEMTVVRFKSMNCEVIELIHPKAFEEFRFGNCVYYNDDVSPDELHISAWHNLGIDPDYVSICLDKFIKNNILGKNDISNIYGVLRYILKWIQLYPDDFFINPDCAVHTCKVLNRVIDKRIEVSSRSNVLKALIKAISQRKKPYAAVHWPLPAVRYKDYHKYQRISIYDKIFKFEKNIDFLVQHFSYIDLCLIRKILRSEIVQLNFLKENKKLSAPHVQDITTRFNIMARFVSYSILSVVRNHSSKLEKKCKSRIEFWISVMKRAREIRNFNLLYEIDAGLLHPSISRLTNVWKTISKSLRDDFNKLHDITKPVSQNMREYINLVLEDPENTVPYLGTFFSRMVYSCEFYHKKDKMIIPQDRLDDISKDDNESNEVTGYNMVYQYYLFKECSKIFLNWGAKYKFKLDINFLQVCKDISFACDDKRLSEFSNQIQPKK